MKMIVNVFWCLNIVCFLGITNVCFAIEAETVIGVAQAVTSATLSKKSTDDIEVAFKSCKADLLKLLNQKGESSPLKDSMDTLKDVVMYSTERANRLATWDMAKVKTEAEADFDKTIQGISEYLKLVEDDGVIHKAAKNIRAAAIEQAREFREKAKAKSSERYEQMANNMTTEAEKVDAIWNVIRQERSGVQAQLVSFKESKELYVDTKKAEGIQSAVKELDQVSKDLAKMGEAMRRVQQTVEGPPVTTDKK